jgi:hypothetical protein
MSGDGCGELLIFDFNSPSYSKIEVFAPHEVGQSKSVYKCFQSEQLVTRKGEVSMLDIICAIDMPAALESALDDPNFMVHRGNRGFF